MDESPPDFTDTSPVSTWWMFPAFSALASPWSEALP